MTIDPGPPAEISDWAEIVASELADARLAGSPPRVNALLHAATRDPAIAYQVLITLSRTVALVLRPTGHPGGPIGLIPEAPPDPLLQRAAQLVGFAAQGDADMVDALARATLAAPHAPLREARTTLWTILEVLASEPMTPQPKDRP